MALRRARGWMLGAGCVAAVVSVASTSCLDATEIRVDISTKADCSKNPNADVLLNDATAPLAQQKGCVPSAPNVGSVVILPKASNDEHVEIRVVGTVDDTIDADTCAASFAIPNVDPTKITKCIEAKRSISFIAHTPLVLPIDLDPICAGKQCDPGFTCGSTGECVPSTTTCDSSGRCGTGGGGADASVDAPRDTSVIDAIATDSGDSGKPPALAAAISARGDTTCVITTSGNVQCWGDDSYGQMGDGQTATMVVPKKISSLANIATLAVGKTHSCATTTQTKLSCWGQNQAGEITGTASNGVLGPSTLPLPMTTKLVAVGDNHTCAWGRYGVVPDTGVPDQMWCWGDPTETKLGVQTSNHTPQSSSSAFMGTTPTSLVAGSNHTCALLGGSNTVKCWGMVASLQVGTGEFAPISDLPKTPISATAISAGANHSGAALKTGAVWWATTAPAR